MRSSSAALGAACLGMALLSSNAAPRDAAERLTYPVVDTGQGGCYGDDGAEIACAGSGQDGAYQGRAARYELRGDVVLDTVTRLEWARAPIEGVTFADVARVARESRLGGHSDWRVPTIKELYSLIEFRGGYDGSPKTSRPYIDPIFDFHYATGDGLGDAAAGRRPIDVQEWSATRYVGKTMGRDEAVFGVNFADGRIKGYPVMDPSTRMTTPHKLNLRLVRGAASYGVNAFVREADVVRDAATALVWQRDTAPKLTSWSGALAYCEGLTLGGRSDWRLPNAKELQSIVDYGRIPALAPVFGARRADAYFWTSTTHLESAPAQAHETRWKKGELAVYVAFGRALGFMESPPGSGRVALLDVHGAGAQRSDPKTAKPGDFPQGFGPQGDDVRGLNAVRCVADAR